MTYQPAIVRTRGNTTYEVVADTGSLSVMEQMLEEIQGLRMDMAQQDGVSVIDGCGSLRRATVNSTGALSVGPPKFDETATAALAVDDQAYNFFSPRASLQFVITGVLAYATRAVNNATDTNISIFESDQPTSATSTKDLMVFGMGSLTNLQLVPLNLLVNPGVYVNGSTDDNTIHMTIMGYYIDLVN